MKSDGSTVLNKNMSSKKKKSSAKSKTEDSTNFNNGRSGSSRSSSNDADPGGFHSNLHDLPPNSTGGRNLGRFQEIPNDGYMGKQPQNSHMNNFPARFSGRIPYSRNEMDNGMMGPMRNEQYSMYDQNKYGFPNSSSGSHHSEFLSPPRHGFGSMMSLGYSGNTQPGFAPGVQPPYPSSTPMLTQLLQYPNQREKPQGPYDECGRTSGATKSWQSETMPGVNQNLHQRPPLPGGGPLMSGSGPQISGGPLMSGGQAMSGGPLMPEGGGPIPGGGYENQQMLSMNQSYPNQASSLPFVNQNQQLPQSASLNSSNFILPHAGQSNNSRIDPNDQLTSHSRSSSNTCEPRSNSNTCEPRSNSSNTSELRLNANTYEPRTNSNTCEPRSNSNTCEPRSNSNTCEPRSNSNTCEPRSNSNTCEPRLNSNTYESRSNLSMCETSSNSPNNIRTVSLSPSPCRQHSDSKKLSHARSKTKKKKVPTATLR